MFSTENWGMVQRVAPRLARYAFAMTQDRAEADALVQAAILTAMNRRAAPSDEAAFRIWLMRFLRRLCMPEAAEGSASEAHREAISAPGNAPGPAPWGGGWTVAWGADELALNRQVVRQGFFALPAAHRDSLALTGIAGFSYAEAARLLDIGLPEVAARVACARAALLAALSETPVVPFRRNMAGAAHD